MKYRTQLTENSYTMNGTYVQWADYTGDEQKWSQKTRNITDPVITSFEGQNR